MATDDKIATLDLTDAGFPDQWVKLRDPKYLSNKHFEELLARISKQDRTKEENEAIFRERIVTWHIFDENGTLMGDPATADLGDVPIGITTAIGGKITELFQVALPNASRSR